MYCFTTFSLCLFPLWNQILTTHVLVKWIRAVHHTTRPFITQYPEPLSSPKLPLVTSARFWWSRIYVWLEGVGVICTSFSELFKLHGSIFISSILLSYQTTTNVLFFRNIAFFFRYYDHQQHCKYARKASTLNTAGSVRNVIYCFIGYFSSFNWC